MGQDTDPPPVESDAPPPSTPLTPSDTTSPSAGGKSGQDAPPPVAPRAESSSTPAAVVSTSSSASTSKISTDSGASSSKMSPDSSTSVTGMMSATLGVSPKSTSLKRTASSSPKPDDSLLSSSNDQADPQEASSSATAHNNEVPSVSLHASPRPHKIPTTDHSCETPETSSASTDQNPQVLLDCLYYPHIVEQILSYRELWTTARNLNRRLRKTTTPPFDHIVVHATDDPSISAPRFHNVPSWPCPRCGDQHGHDPEYYFEMAGYGDSYCYLHTPPRLMTLYHREGGRLCPPTSYHDKVCDWAAPTSIVKKRHDSMKDVLVVDIPADLDICEVAWLGDAMVNLKVVRIFQQGLPGRSDVDCYEHYSVFKTPTVVLLPMKFSGRLTEDKDSGTWEPCSSTDASAVEGEKLISVVYSSPSTGPVFTRHHYDWDCHDDSPFEEVVYYFKDAEALDISSLSKDKTATRRWKELIEEVGVYALWQTPVRLVNFPNNVTFKKSDFPRKGRWRKPTKVFKVLVKNVAEEMGFDDEDEGFPETPLRFLTASEYEDEVGRETVELEIGAQ